MVMRMQKISWKIMRTSSNCLGWEIVWHHGTDDAVD